MITLIEALNYRCLRYIRQPLGPFHVLVGANASGKSTFLDVIGFLRDLVTRGLDEAVELRSSNFYDLVWQRKGGGFELAVEVAIPESVRESLEDSTCTTVRYEVAIRLDADSNRLEMVAEQAWLKSASSGEYDPSVLLPQTLIRQNAVAEDDSLRPAFLVGRYLGPTGKSILAGASGIPTNVLAELARGLKPGAMLESAASSNLRVGSWLRDRLMGYIFEMQLETLHLREPSPPGQGTWIHKDGSNLPWVVARLEEKSPERFRQWVEHLQAALPDLTGITTTERPEERSRYLSLEYRDGLKVPSWMVSDGTLRLLALTLPAYLLDFDSTLLVEEPENGLHPLAIETVYQSLSSVYDGQVLLATHSPMMVAVAKPEEVICFSKDDDGAAQIVTGSQHPRLRDWRGEIDLGTLFASGVLG